MSADETTATPEQEARDLLEAAGVEGAQSMTTGDLVGIANLVAEVRTLRARPLADETTATPLDLDAIERAADPTTPEAWTQHMRDQVAALAEDEFATDETAEIPEWGGDFERGAMWAFAEAARLTRAALDRGEVSS